MKYGETRFSTLNAIVDEIFPHLTASECRLLTLYYRHAKLKRPRGKEGIVGSARNVVWMGDRPAGQRLGLTREAVRMTRLSLIEKGVLRKAGGVTGGYVIEHNRHSGRERLVTQ